MSTEQEHSQVVVFYGDQPAHDHERRAINQLRTELDRRRIPATLLVNFTVARGARQIDLVIITDQRCLNVELKHLDPAYPLYGPLNGLWCQRLPDGTERMRDRNCYEQALQETYGLADVLTRLWRKGEVPAPARREFKKDIDTVVGIDPRIPDGSILERHAYVTAIGLDALVDRVAAPGPGLAHWSRRDWERVIRELQLYAEGDDSAEELRRVADAAALEEYRRNFVEFLSAGLDPLVPVSVSDPQPKALGAADLAGLLTGAERVLLTGESGQGKSHLSRHAALALSADGGLVIWLAADDYEKDRLGRSLSRAVSPFTTEKPHPLLAKATQRGVGITVIIDALEGCPHREELLKQIRALQRQYPASVLVSSTDGEEPQLTATRTIHLLDPGDAEREQLAATYGGDDAVAGSTEFQTRLDLALAAQVKNDMPAGATTTEVLDTFIGQRAGTETVRAGLRALALAMDSGVRSVLAAGAASLILRRSAALAGSPSAIDDTLACRLLSVRQGLVRFSHESFARFLAAEELVLSARDGAELAQLLSQPAHHDLQHHALSLEADPERRYDAIRGMGSAELLAAAAGGEFGADTAKQAQADITELLVSATATAGSAVFDRSDDIDDWMSGSWQLQRAWTPMEFAALSAAGRCAHRGLFLGEIGALMDATDTVLRNAMIELRDAGSRRSISTVIAASFAPMASRDSLAASVVASAAEHQRVFTKALPAEPAPVATPLWRHNSRCFGRLYLAAILSQRIRHPIDGQNLPDLVETGLAAGGYHLRLELIQAAQFACRVLDSGSRTRMINVLNAYQPDPGDWGTSSLLIEALASYDQITPMTTLKAITEQINEVLVDHNDPDRRRLARGIVASQYEDERILGPYTEAIDALPEHKRLTLFAMSVLAPGYGSISNPYALRHLADGVRSPDGIIGAALAHYAGAVPDDTVVRSEDVASHLHGLQGWAKISETLPPSTNSRDEPFAVAWRMFDELLLRLVRAEADEAAADAIWRQLLADFPAHAAQIMSDIYRADMSLVTYHDKPGQEFSPHRMLVHTYPEQLRQLTEWALAHRAQLTRPDWPHAYGDLAVYAIRTLALVGTADTADLLRHHYIHDTALGREAIHAVQAIDTRLAAR